MLVSLWLILLLFAAAPASAADQFTAGNGILILGDSLSAGYGIERSSSWPELLAQALRRRALPYRVINASISGETSRGGAARIDALLGTHRPALCIVELGANDGLRGLSLQAMQRNLEDIIESCRGTGASVLLIGMRLPPNYGRRYTEGFAKVYRELADRQRIPLVPFFLEGVIQHTDWMQADGLHPRAEAQPVLLRTVWTALAPLLDAADPGAPTPRDP